MDGSTCRCEEQWTGADCNTRMLKKKRRKEEKKKELMKQTKKVLILYFSSCILPFVIYQLSVMWAVATGSVRISGGTTTNVCATSTSTLAAARTIVATHVSPPPFLTYLFSSPSIVPLSKPPHHYILSQLLTRSFSHCYIQLIAQDAAHTPLALVALRAVNLAATVTRGGPTVEKVATATSSSATAMYVFSSRLFSYPLLSYRHVHPFLMFQKSSAKN